MNNLKLNDKVIIQSFKHNGILHRTWKYATIADIDDEKIVVITEKSRVIEGAGREWVTREPAILYFYFNRWFNTIAMLREDGVYHYTNIASPVLVEGMYLKYIDYDIDVKTYPSGNYKILDMGEYYCHKNAMEYGNDIEEIIFKSLDEVIYRFENKQEPFIIEKSLEYIKSK